jgi:hypothetical protein
VAAARAGLAAQVGDWLEGRGEVDFSGLRLTALSLELAEQRITVRGAARGQVAVVVQ